MDPHQIEVLYDRYRVGLYRYALSILKCPSLAEDALHETFVRLMTTRFPPEQPQAWLYRVVRNICYDDLRRQKHLQAETVQVAENDLAYLELIAPLSKKEQEVVSLKILGRLTHKEIARVLGITPHGAQKRYDRAIQKLRRLEEVL